MSWASSLLRPDIVVFLIPLAGILLAMVAIVMGGLIKVAKMVIVHRERMAKIAQGMDPDYVGPLDDSFRR